MCGRTDLRARAGQDAKTAQQMQAELDASQLAMNNAEGLAEDEAYARRLQSAEQGQETLPRLRGTGDAIVIDD